jgi:arylsulfatase A-like enzyme
MSTADRPNLLFLFTDEQRLDTLRCYGNSRIEMPYLNRLAGESVVFEDPYCAQPVCTPSRGTLMTGLMPHAHGAVNNNIPLNAGAKCLPELLHDDLRRQYTVGYHGKWHLGDELFLQHGHDQWLSIEDIYHPHFSEGRDRDARSDYQHFLLEQGFTLGSRREFTRGFAAQLPEPYSKPWFLANHASRFIRENRDRPWMLTVNFLEPHMPFHGPRDGQYDPADVPLPDNFDAPPGADQPDVCRRKYERFRDRGFGGFPLKTEDDWRAMIARYWGLCSLVDTHVGTILETLRRTGQDRDTIVVFTSDHGDQMGSHQMLTKGVMYRESTQVPLLLRLPGQRRGGRVSGPVSQIDLVPTLLDLMGVEPADHLHGRSLAGLCRDAEESADPVPAADRASDCVIEWNPHPDADAGDQDNLAAPAVRTLVTADQWRFSHSAAGEHELYDLADDPGERRNLARDPAQADRLRSLTEQLRDWQRRVDDPLELHDPV